jgi:hypothetical protein
MARWMKENKMKISAENISIKEHNNMKTLA